MSWEIVPAEPPDNEAIDAAALARLHRTLPPTRDDPGYSAWLVDQRTWWNHNRRKLEQRLLDLLDDGTGLTHPALARLGWEIAAMPHPDRGLNWLHNSPLPGTYLRGLARGTIPLTHQGLHDLDSWRTSAHLRDLLMATGALPQIDRQITLFERWCQQRLAEITDPEHAQLLRSFARWNLLPRLHTKARQGPLTTGTRNAAASRLNGSLTLLAWLADHGTALNTLRQGDVDAWFATGPDPHRTRTFFRWAMTSGHAPRLALPPQRHTLGTPSARTDGSNCCAGSSPTTPLTCAPESRPASFCCSPNPSPACCG